MDASFSDCSFVASLDFFFKKSSFLLRFLLRVEGLFFFNLLNQLGGLLLPGFQGEGDRGAQGEVEGEVLPLAGQHLAELQELAKQGRVTSTHSGRHHLHWLESHQ